MSWKLTVNCVYYAIKSMKVKGNCTSLPAGASVYTWHTISGSISRCSSCRVGSWDLPAGSKLPGILKCSITIHCLVIRDHQRSAQTCTLSTAQPTSTPTLSTAQNRNPDFALSPTKWILQSMIIVSLQLTLRKRRSGWKQSDDNSALLTTAERRRHVQKDTEHHWSNKTV